MVDLEENKRLMAAGELYHAFTPDLVAARQRCAAACDRLNNAGREIPRRQQIELWRDICQDKTPMPPVDSDPDADEALFANDPWIDGPIKCDYGTNVILGAGSYVNFGCVFIDTCIISIGARTLVAPNVQFYSGTHPLDPALRNGIQGPELGKEIHVGEDCWIGGGAILLPGVTLGKGVTVGAGSVVTKDVPDFHVVAGNPARILRKIETSMDTTQQSGDRITNTTKPDKA